MKNLIFTPSLLLLASCGSSEKAPSTTDDAAIAIAMNKGEEAARLGASVNIDPKDVEAMGIPVLPGATVEGGSNMSAKGRGMSIVTFQSDKSPANAEAWYKQALPAKGYKLGPDTLENDMRRINAELGDTVLTVRFDPKQGGKATEILAVLHR